MALGDVIRLWRAELGWKQEDLARRAGGRPRQSEISDLERGKDPSRDPGGDTWEGLAHAFGVSMDTLKRVSRLPADEIPSVASVVRPELAGLPGWVRDFHRWGSKLSPVQRSAMLEMARALALEALERERAEMPQNTESNPGDDET